MSYLTSSTSHIRYSIQYVIYDIQYVTYNISVHGFTPDTCTKRGPRLPVDAAPVDVPVRLKLQLEGAKDGLGRTRASV